MATFSLIIDGAFAFNLKVAELTDGFYDTLRSNPKVVVCSGFDVLVGDSYIEQTFYREGIPLAESVPNVGTTKFAFICGDTVYVVQEIPNDNEMLVAAYSSDPRFIEVQ